MEEGPTESDHISIMHVENALNADAEGSPNL